MSSQPACMRALRPELHQRVHLKSAHRGKSVQCEDGWNAGDVRRKFPSSPSAASHLRDWHATLALPGEGIKTGYTKSSESMTKT